MLILKTPKNTFRWFVTFLSLIGCVTLIGCTVIGDLSWKTMILGKYAVKSSLGSTELSLEFIPDPNSFKNASQNEKDTWRRLDSLNSATLKYKRVKEDSRTMSWNGELQTRYGAIPLQVNIRNGQFAAKLAGSDQQFVMPLHQLVVKNGWINFPLTYPMQERFNARFQEMIPLVMEFLLDHLPDPPAETVNVESTTIELNAEEGFSDAVAVKHIRVAMNAKQLNAYMAQGIQNILNDTAGQAKLIEKVLAILTVPVSTSLEAAVIAEEDRWIVDIIKPMVVSELNKMITAWKNGNVKNALNVQWWVDEQQSIRQFDANLVMYPYKPWAGLKGYELSLKRKSTQINQTQVADVMVFKPWPSNTMWSEQAWLQTAQKDSVLYTALLKHYQITRQSITLKSGKLVAPKTAKGKKTTTSVVKMDKDVRWSLVNNKTQTHVSLNWIQRNLGDATWNAKTKTLTVRAFSSDKANKLPAKAILIEGKNTWFLLSEVCKIANVEAKWFESIKQWDLITDAK